MSAIQWSDMLRQLSTGAEIPVGIQESQDFLEMLLSILEMLQLYQECFPEEFARDDEAGLSIFPVRDGHYSPREVHFFFLVNEYYFPLPLDFLPDDIMGERQFTRYIPLTRLGFDLYEEDLYEYLSLGWKLLLYLLGSVDEDWLKTASAEEELVELDEDLFRIPLERCDVSATLLSLRCSSQGGECSWLMLAIEMLQNRTDSVWLNETMDEPYMDFCWTKEDMEELRQQYILALDIQEKAMRFCAWLEADPLSHFSQLAHLWNSCARDTPKPEKRSQMMAITPEDWVDGINVDALMGRAILLPAARESGGS